MLRMRSAGNARHLPENCGAKSAKKVRQNGGQKTAPISAIVKSAAPRRQKIICEKIKFQVFF